MFNFEISSIMLQRRLEKFETEHCNAETKGVASMRQDEAIASSCFRRRQIFAHLFHDKANVNFN